MTCMLLGAVINTILDPLFIFTFGMGIAGAAWATVIGQVASCVMAASYILRFQHIRLTRQSFGIPLREAGRIASLGMSNSLNQLAITLVQIVLNNSLTYYGAMTVYGSDIPLASCGIVMKTNAILIGIIVGLSQEASPLSASITEPGRWTASGPRTGSPSRAISSFRRWALCCSSSSRTS